MSSTDGPTTAAALVAELGKHADAARAWHNTRFFRTGPGEYGEGDTFLGCTVPDVRGVTRSFRGLPLDEVELLLDDPVHEHRLAGVLLLAEQFRRADEGRRAEILTRYLDGLHRGAINNWDLVDASAAQVLGAGGDEPLWAALATGGNLWERRAAIIATFAPLRSGDVGPSLRIAELLAHDEHDLIHKATGWVLREVGKRDDRALRAFLDHWGPELPRTMLRYAIERFGEEDREHYLRLPRRRTG